MVVVMRADFKSFMASTVAWKAEMLPLPSFACTASTTTIESSTTVPMTSTRAKSVSKLSENPTAYMKANVPMSDTRMAMIGTTIDRQLRKKMNTTITTRMIAMMRVSVTLRMEAFKKSITLVWSSRIIPSGSVWRTSSSTLSICLTISFAFVPAVCVMLADAPGLPLVVLFRL